MLILSAKKYYGKKGLRISQNITTKNAQKVLYINLTHIQLVVNTSQRYFYIAESIKY